MRVISWQATPESIARIAWAIEQAKKREVWVKEPASWYWKIS